MTRFACPQCRQPLSVTGQDFTCSRCGSTGKDIDGIPCFADPDYYWGEIPLEQMQEANRLARDVGWQTAVDRIVLSKSVRDYICNPRRADFQHVWDLPADSSVLDIGAGWGAIAASLGRNFSHVVALEGVLERARFIDTRVRQMQLPVEVICADFLRLPLAPEQFDAVVLNGVLEWAAMTAQGDPRQVQLRFLRSVRDLLKPSGFVCIGIENRIGWAMLCGGIDHSGLPYTSLMPRKIAAMRCGMRRDRYRSGANVGYRTYTYSLPGYRKLFREAGLGAVRLFHAWDGYNNPTVLLPLDHPRALLHFIEQHSLARSGWGGRVKDAIMRAAVRTGLWRQFASEFIFVIEKN